MYDILQGDNIFWKKVVLIMFTRGLDACAFHTVSQTHLLVENVNSAWQIPLKDSVNYWMH